MPFKSTTRKLVPWSDDEQTEKKNEEKKVNGAVNLVMTINDFNTVVTQLVNIANFMKKKADEYIEAVKKFNEKDLDTNKKEWNWENLNQL